MKKTFLLILIFFTINIQSQITDIESLFGIDCNYKINRIENRNRFITIIEERNVLEFIKVNNRIYLGNLFKKDIGPYVQNFLENNSDQNCSYCKGRNSPKSSSNPQNAFIKITNYKRPSKEFNRTYGFKVEDQIKFEKKFTEQRSISVENFLALLRKMYNRLWTSQYNNEFNSKLNASEFNKLDCNVKNYIRKKYYPVNVILGERWLLSSPKKYK